MRVFVILSANARCVQQPLREIVHRKPYLLEAITMRLLYLLWVCQYR